VLAPTIAGAQQEDRQHAREAYERGTQAYKRGDYAAAVAAYREADEAAPSPIALQAALDAAVKADDPVLGSELLERAHGRNVEGALAASVKKAEAKLGHRAGRVHLTCAKPCTAMLDGAALLDGGTRWASPGDHEVLIVVDRKQASVHATVAVDQTAEVAAPAELVTPHQTSPTPVVAPPSTTSFVAQKPVSPALGSAREPSPHGLRRGWFWAGVGATGAGGVGTALGFIGAMIDHDQFVSRSCSTVGSAKCSSLASQGMLLQVVGNVFVGIGSVAAVWTLVSGVWLVHWGNSRVGASVGPSGGVLTWTRSF